MPRSHQLLELPAPVINSGPYKQYNMGKCVYCGRQLFRTGQRHVHRPDRYTRDHVFPKSLGIRKPNITVPCCHECNCAKGNRMPTHAEIFSAVLYRLYNR